MQPPDAEFEKFTADIDIDQPSTSHHRDEHSSLADSHLMVAFANIRRHTVGPGDVAHEQALNHPTAAINFKFDPNATMSMMAQPQIPINLPMLMNQPINTFTIKDQHLLRPPMEMGASEC